MDEAGSTLEEHAYPPDRDGLATWMVDGIKYEPIPGLHWEIRRLEPEVSEELERVRRPALQGCEREEDAL